MEQLGNHRTRVTGRATAAALALLLISAALPAGPASIVRDLKPQPTFEWGPFDWEEYVELDGAVYFAADDGVHGRELWRWVPGYRPEMLVDLCPGVCGAKPRQLTPFADGFFFVADDGNRGFEPWFSDGSAGGTRLLADLSPGPATSLPDFPTVLGDRLYFAAGGNPGEDRELWSTDATPAGTERLLDIEPGATGSSPVSLTALDDTLYFTARTSGAGRELWTSDGTAAGTKQLLDHCPGPCDAFWDEQWTPFGSSRVLQPFRGRLLVAAGAGGPSELHALQHHPPALLHLAHATSVWAQFPRLGNRFVFAGCDSNGTDCEPWWSDGTPAGTSKITDVRPGTDGSNPQLLGTLGAEVLFFAHDGVTGFELWTSDGTAAGTEQVADIAEGPATSAPLFDRFPGLVVGDRMVFRADDGVHGIEYWTTDGTTAGTELLLDAWPGPLSSQPWGAIGRRLVVDGLGLISAQSPTAGLATWTTDGTASGTELFLDANRQSSAVALRPILGTPLLRAHAVGGGLLFGADDGATGDEPWITDGTDGGTRLLADLVPGESDIGVPASSAPIHFFDGPGFALVGAQDGVWSIDLATSTPSLLSAGSIQSPFLSLPGGDSGALYVEYDGTDGFRLQSTDGTPAGTSVLLDGVGDRPLLLRHSSTLVFSRDTETWGAEPWAYPLPDGPAILLADLLPGDDGSRPRMLGTLRGEAFFAATHPDFGRELWATDGTPEGTRLIRDIAAGTADGSPARPDSDRLPPTTSEELFFIADDGVAGAELWLTNGTEAGTRLVADVRPGGVSSNPRGFESLGDRVFFTADDGVHGREPWVANASGARLVRDLRAGADSSVDSRFTFRRVAAVRERVFFGATDGKSGVELWSSDGSAAGTYRVQDIHPGAGSSSPTGLVVAGDRLYFAATDGLRGFELWSLPLDFEIFVDGFESGDTGAWSVTVP